MFKNVQILSHVLATWQFKYYGQNAPYHAPHCGAWNSSSFPLGPPACEDSAALLSENLSSLQVGGPQADDAGQQEFTDQTDDTWSGLCHGRHRNQIHLNSLKQLTTSPSHLSTEQSYKSSVVWGTGLSSDKHSGRKSSSSFSFFSGFSSPGIAITFSTSL